MDTDMRNDVIDWLGDYATPALRIVLVIVLTEMAVLVAKRIIRSSAARLVGRAVQLDEQLMSSLTELSGPVNLEPSHLKTARNQQRVQALMAVLSSVVAVVIRSIGIFTILGVLGINLAPLIAGAGIAGIALGFGAQSMVKDFLSGMLMLVEDQYGVGDIIDVGDATGVVEAISLRTTRLRSVDGTVWHFPNGEIRRVGNMSQNWSRCVLDVGVSYDASVPEVITALQRMLDEFAADAEWTTKLIGEPEVLGVENLADSSVVIRTIVTTVPAQQWKVARELRKRVKATLDAEGIVIPYPQHTIHITPNNDDK
jgi:moderate conductance mechanosensitive channel